MSTNISGHKKVWEIIKQDDIEGQTVYNKDPAPMLPLSTFMAEPTFPAQASVANVACRFKWDYPIVNLMSGHIRTCCRVSKQVVTDEDLDTYGIDAIQNLPYEQDRRREKLLGITNVDCESCVRLEHNGATSPREGLGDFVNQWLIGKNAAYPSAVKDTQQWYVDKIPNTADQLPFDHPLLRANKPDMLEIVLGNQCDLKCTYCSVQYSTQWQAELIKFGDIKKEDLTKHFPAAPEKLEKVFWEWFYDVGRHSSRVINILGGEPTLMPKFYDVMDKLTAAYKDLGTTDRHVELGILSNMNTKPIQMDRFMNSLSKLTKHIFVRLQPSIEAVGDRAEYIRHGLDWNRFEGNIRRVITERDKYGLTSDNFGMGFQMAINSFSISSLPDFVHWTNSLINEYDFEIGLMKNVVSFPRHHNPQILTPDYVSYLEQARDYIGLCAEKNDRQINRLCKKFPTLNDHGSWSSYNTYLLDGLITSMESSERNQYDLDSRVNWFQFVEQMKVRRNVDVLSSHPEMTDFYNLCKQQSLNN